MKTRAALLLVLALAACGPQLRTNYNLLPPPTPQGQVCAGGCLLMSNTCVENCRLMSRKCESYDASTGVGFGTGWRHHGGMVEAGLTRPLSSADCSARQCEENCLAAARQCHLTCGGTITSETVCVANCPTR